MFVLRCRSNAFVILNELKNLNRLIGGGLACPAFVSRGEDSSIRSE